MAGEMESAARAFCAAVERQDVLEPREAAEQLLAALTAVVAAAVLLPAAEYEDGDAREVTAAQWQAVHRRLGHVLGPFGGHYWEWLHPFARDERAARAGLGEVEDDLADVWHDLTDGLLRLEDGAPLQQVLGQWRDSFWWHWGHHAASASRVLMLGLRQRE